MKSLKPFMLLSMSLLVLACVEDLAVENLDNPDTDRVLRTGSDVEALISGAYLTHFIATEGWAGPNGLSVMADENTSSWGNTAMKDLSSEPRVAFNNTATYVYKEHVEEPWYGLYSAISSVNEGLQSIAAGVDIGVGGAGNARAEAFGKFVQGISFGFLAEMFDQAFIVDETNDMEAIAAGTEDVSLSSYTDVMAAAIGYLDKCIELCSNDFTTPDTWINEVSLTSVQLKRLAHSYQARFTASVARTPAERAAVDWSAVKTHIGQGIEEGADFGPVGDGYVNWWSDFRWITYNNIWTRADYKTIGLTDTSGNYQDWLDTPVAQRTEFLIHTADRRITGPPDTLGSGAKVDGKYFYYAGNSFFRSARGTYHFSMYCHGAYLDYYVTEATPMWTLTYVEMRLLEAEAEYRLGNLAAAAEIVNETRVANGELPPLDGSESDFFEWLKYEKKVETFASPPGLAYFDRRGWGDLVTGTPLHFPVPAKELEVSLLGVYTHGGTTGDYASKLLSGRRHPSRQTLD